MPLKLIRDNSAACREFYKATLILVRHAKSSWNFDVDDHDRPLSGRGRRDAEAIGRVLTVSKAPVLFSRSAVDASASSTSVSSPNNAAPVVDTEPRIDLRSTSVLARPAEADAGI